MSAEEFMGWAAEMLIRKDEDEGRERGRRLVERAEQARKGRL